MEIIETDRARKKRKCNYEDCIKENMSPAQKEVFLIVDEYWKMYGRSPTLATIAEMRNKSGLANTKKLVDRLVKMGILKRVSKMHRTIRPVYINFRKVE